MRITRKLVRFAWLIMVASATVGFAAEADKKASTPAADSTPGTDAAAPASTDGQSSTVTTSSPDASPDASDSSSSASPAPVAQARPAEIMPRAPQSLMLAIVNTGEHLVAVGDRGEILVSNDGKNWAQVPVPVRAPLTAVTFVDAKNGWAVGHDAVIVHTADGGKTWSLQNFQPELEKPFLGVNFIDANHGFAVGAYGLLDETTDGGTTWNEVKAPAIRGDELHLYSISKLGNGDLLVAGEQGTLGLSTDSGKTWKKLKSPYEGTWFGSVPVGARGALLCGLRGHASLTDDVRGGKWKAIETNTTASLFGCSAAPGDEAVMVGLNGLVMTVNTQTGQIASGSSGVDGALSTGALISTGVVVGGERGLQLVAAPAAK